VLPRIINDFSVNPFGWARPFVLYVVNGVRAPPTFLDRSYRLAWTLMHRMIPRLRAPNGCVVHPGHRRYMLATYAIEASGIMSDCRPTQAAECSVSLIFLAIRKIKARFERGRGAIRAFSSPRFGTANLYCHFFFPNRRPRHPPNSSPANAALHTTRRFFRTGIFSASRFYSIIRFAFFFSEQLVTPIFNAPPSACPRFLLFDHAFTHEPCGSMTFRFRAHAIRECSQPPAPLLANPTTKTSDCSPQPPALRKVLLSIDAIVGPKICF